MLPRPLPFRISFIPLGRIEPSAARQIDHFKWKYYKKDKPVLFQPKQFQREIAAIQKWFQPLPDQDHVKKSEKAQTLNREYLNAQLNAAGEQWKDLTVPLERLVTAEEGEGGKDTFERFEAPFSVFMDWNAKKLEDPTFSPNTSLYLAQCSLDLLPPSLLADVPPVQFVKDAGKGGIYASSLWMGVPPTNTPLHKDPNPNILVQLAGRKKIRMFPPIHGEKLYFGAKRICAEVEGTQEWRGGGPSMRGEEMMVGLEKKILGSLVWGDEEGLWEDIPVPTVTKAADTVKEVDEVEQDEEFNAFIQEVQSASTPKRFKNKLGKKDDDGPPKLQGLEAEIGPGDGVFIPSGWWHSLRSFPPSSEPSTSLPAPVTKLSINASVNWWFHGGKLTRETGPPKTRRISKDGLVRKTFYTPDEVVRKISYDPIKKLNVSTNKDGRDG